MSFSHFGTALGYREIIWFPGSRDLYILGVNKYVLAERTRKHGNPFLPDITSESNLSLGLFCINMLVFRSMVILSISVNRVRHLVLDGTVTRV